MNKYDFTELLKQPAKLGTEHIDTLKKLTSDFPYFSTAHVLLAKALFNTKHYEYEKQLKTTALVAADRGVLYRFLNDIDPAKEREVEQTIHVPTDLRVEKISKPDFTGTEKEEKQAFEIPITLEVKKEEPKTEFAPSFEQPIFPHFEPEAKENVADELEWKPEPRPEAESIANEFAIEPEPPTKEIESVTPEPEVEQKPEWVFEPGELSGDFVLGNPDTKTEEIQHPEPIAESLFQAEPQVIEEKPTEKYKLTETEGKLVRFEIPVSKEDILSDFDERSLIDSEERVETITKPVWEEKPEIEIAPYVDKTETKVPEPEGKPYIEIAVYTGNEPDRKAVHEVTFDGYLNMDDPKNAIYPGPIELEQTAKQREHDEYESTEEAQGEIYDASPIQPVSLEHLLDDAIVVENQIPEAEPFVEEEEKADELNAASFSFLNNTDSEKEEELAETFAEEAGHNFMDWLQLNDPGMIPAAESVESPAVFEGKAADEEFTIPEQSEKGEDANFMSHVRDLIKQKQEQTFEDLEVEESNRGAGFLSEIDSNLQELEAKSESTHPLKTDLSGFEFEAPASVTPKLKYDRISGLVPDYETEAFEPINAHKEEPLELPDFDISPIDESSFERNFHDFYAGKSTVSKDEETEASPVEFKNNRQSDDVESILDRFIRENPSISRPKAEFYDPVNQARQSVEEDEGLVSETLAGIYLRQGLVKRAISAYEKLCLIYPHKLSYFATLIKQLKSEHNIE